MRKRLFLFITVLLFGISGAHAQDVPQVTSFTTTETSVERNALAERTARIPVEWISTNRFFGTNLVFEQVFPNGDAINIELPRLIPWVNASGEGVVAPVLPNASTVVLRVRLVNIFTGDTYDSETITLPISGQVVTPIPTGEPGNALITLYDVEEDSVPFGELASGEARLTVVWQVTNRPADSNLVFEQVFRDGSVRNVELPRDNPVVPSSGTGVVAPFPPEQDETTITIQMRLVNLNNSTTLAQRTDAVAVTRDESDLLDGLYTIVPQSECFSDDFFDATGVEVGTRGRVIAEPTQDGLPLKSDVGIFAQTTGLLQIGETFTVLDGPFCYREDDIALTFREWRVRDDATQRIGWIQTYSAGTQQIFIAPVDPEQPSNNPVVELVEFVVLPNPAPASSQVEVRWNVRGAANVTVTWFPDRQGVQGLREDIRRLEPPIGRAPVQLDERQVGQVPFVIEAYDPNGNLALTETYTLEIECTIPLAFDDPTLEDACPLNPIGTVDGTFQRFERGALIWRADVDQIIALYDDGTFARYPDTWDGETVTFETDPPPGLLAPVRGFGKLLQENDAVFARLGWATAPEQGYAPQIQRVVRYTDNGVQTIDTYITDPNERAYRLPDVDNGLWARIAN